MTDLAAGALGYSDTVSNGWPAAASVARGASRGSHLPGGFGDNSSDCESLDRAFARLMQAPVAPALGPLRSHSSTTRARRGPDKKVKRPNTTMPLTGARWGMKCEKCGETRQTDRCLACPGRCKTGCPFYPEIEMDGQRGSCNRCFSSNQIKANVTRLWDQSMRPNSIGALFASWLLDFFSQLDPDPSRVEVYIGVRAKFKRRCTNGYVACATRAQQKYVVHCLARDATFRDSVFITLGPCLRAASCPCVACRFEFACHSSDPARWVEYATGAFQVNGMLVPAMPTPRVDPLTTAVAFRSMGVEATRGCTASKIPVKRLTPEIKARVLARPPGYKFAHVAHPAPNELQNRQGICPVCALGESIDIHERQREAQGANALLALCKSTAEICGKTVVFDQLLIPAHARDVVIHMGARVTFTAMVTDPRPIWTPAASSTPPAALSGPWRLSYNIAMPSRAMCTPLTLALEVQTRHGLLFLVQTTPDTTAAMGIMYKKMMLHLYSWGTCGETESESGRALPASSPLVIASMRSSLSCMYFEFRMLSSMHVVARLWACIVHALSARVTAAPDVSTTIRPTLHVARSFVDHLCVMRAQRRNDMGPSELCCLQLIQASSPGALFLFTTFMMQRSATEALRIHYDTGVRKCRSECIQLPSRITDAGRFTHTHRRHAAILRWQRKFISIHRAGMTVPQDGVSSTWRRVEYRDETRRAIDRAIREIDADVIRIWNTCSGCSAPSPASLVDMDWRDDTTRSKKRKRRPSASKQCYMCKVQISFLDICRRRLHPRGVAYRFRSDEIQRGRGDTVKVTVGGTHIGDGRVHDAALGLVHFSQYPVCPQSFIDADRGIMHAIATGCMSTADALYTLMYACGAFDLEHAKTLVNMPMNPRHTKVVEFLKVVSHEECHPLLPCACNCDRFAIGRGQLAMDHPDVITRMLRERIVYGAPGTVLARIAAASSTRPYRVIGCGDPMCVHLTDFESVGSIQAFAREVVSNANRLVLHLPMYTNDFCRSTTCALHPLAIASPRASRADGLCTTCANHVREWTGRTARLHINRLKMSAHKAYMCRATCSVSSLSPLWNAMPLALRDMAVGTRQHTVGHELWTQAKLVSIAVSAFGAGMGVDRTADLTTLHRSIPTYVRFQHGTHTRMFVHLGGYPYSKRRWSKLLTRAQKKHKNQLRHLLAYVGATAADKQANLYNDYEGERQELATLHTAVASRDASRDATRDATRDAHPGRVCAMMLDLLVERARRTPFDLDCIRREAVLFVQRWDTLTGNTDKIRFLRSLYRLKSQRAFLLTAMLVNEHDMTNGGHHLRGVDNNPFPLAVTNLASEYLAQKRGSDLYTYQRESVQLVLQTPGLSLDWIEFTGAACQQPMYYVASIHLIFDAASAHPVPMLISALDMVFLWLRQMPSSRSPSPEL